MTIHPRPLGGLDDRVAAFLAGSPFAVVGASADRQKYGNKVLRAYMQHGREVYPVNPKAGEIEGLAAFPSLSAAARPIHGVSIITPPAVTLAVVEEAGRLGIRHVWMQPGAESGASVALAERLGMNVIGGDACVLVVLGFREH